MTEDLKSAIRTIAEYDGVTLREDDSFWNDKDEYGHWMNIKHLPYKTSADALLPVYNKALKQAESNWSKMTQDTRTNLFGMPYEHGTGFFDECSMLIVEMDYPSACLKLAEIIKLNNI